MRTIAADPLPLWQGSIAVTVASLFTLFCPFDDATVHTLAWRAGELDQPK